MSFVFRGARSDIESGFSGFIPERRAVRVHAARPINTNSLAFLVMVLLLFTILNSHQMSPNFMIWLFLEFFWRPQALGCMQLANNSRLRPKLMLQLPVACLVAREFRLHIPPSIALATRGRLQGLRLQLALLDREFDDLDYETLRALDSDNASPTPSMSEEEINALPVHKYKVTDPKSNEDLSVQHGSSSSATVEPKQDCKNTDLNAAASEDELTCSICLEQVNRGELVRSLPCLHQFHANCIHPWLRQQGTCPVCKLTVGSGWQEIRESETDGDDMV